jgi:hypothetical protein
MSADVGSIRYPAFLSYSHRDAVFARRLHRRLEAYALPRRLVGRSGPRGPVPARLTPIFRDREELPAADSLSAEVRAALAASGALVVVCSPAAAASPWVAREIDTFRDLHPGRPVLAVLAEGEPGDAFPPLLLNGGTEPLAADFRKGQDGEGLGFLKLVSGIAGVGLDELIQRDAQRRLRAVTAVTAGAVAVMLAMGGLAVFAFEARAEADRRRADAEGLVEFMITDLRVKLKEVGRLDVMGAVNGRALAYYSSQALDRLTPEQLEHRAVLLHELGEDDEKRGDLKGALAQFQEAKRLTGALLEQEPNDQRRIFTHAQSEYWVGFFAWRTGDFANARAGFENYAMLANQLVQADPSNIRWRREHGYAASNLGMLALRDENNPTVAKAQFVAALNDFAVVTRAWPRDGEARRDLADAYAWLADSKKAVGRFDEARADRRAEREILLQLRSQSPMNAGLARDLLGNSLGLAQIDIEQGNPLRARRELKDALAQVEQQRRLDGAAQDVEQLEVVIGLTLIRSGAILGNIEDIRRKQYCSRAVVKGSQELTDYCNIISAKWSLKWVERQAALKYLSLNKNRLSRTRRSARWGIDFEVMTSSVTTQ